MFLLSVILMVGALILVLKGRGQLNEAFQAWHRGDREVFQQFAYRGRWFIYPAWALAAGGVVCLFASYRRRERAWRWTVVCLVLLFLLLGLAPG
jgi:cell division protein FtsW (lipid II flippase)